jgi:hypothetical protein
MLPDAVRARIADLLTSIAGEGAVVALCNSRREVEVCVGEVGPYLGVLDGFRGSALTEHVGRQAWVERLNTGFDLVVAADSVSIGNVLRMCNATHSDLQSLLGPEGPDDPAVAAAMKARTPGAA